MSNEALLRSLTVVGEGAILLQPEIDKVVEQLVEYENPLRQNLPRKRGTGQAWILNRRSPSATAATFVNDTEAFTEATGSYEQVSFPYKTIGAQVKASRKIQATGKTYGNIFAEEVEARLLEIKDFEDYSFLWGQSVANSPISGMGSDKEFDGIHALMDRDANTVIPASATGVDGGYPTLKEIDEAIDKVRGTPNMIIASKAGRRILSSLLQSQQRFEQVVEVKGGFQLVSYMGIPIYTSTNIPNTIRFEDGDILNGLSGGSTTAIFVLDTAKVFIGELEPLQMLKLDKTTAQFDAYDIFESIAVVVRDPRAISRIIGVKPS